MVERPPNGFFVRDLIVFNHLRRGGYVSKGFIFEAPDLLNSPASDLNAFQDQLCLLLASLHEHQRLQVQYFCDSDFRSELLRYQQETERFTNVWTKRARNERFTRYWQAMAERKLRRQRVILYISRALENVPATFQTAAARRNYYAALLDQLMTEYAHVFLLLLDIFGSTSTRILPMSDLDHFRHYKRFLNPSLAERFDYDPSDSFAEELNIHENCWHSEGSGQSDFGFYLDGHYHSIIVLTRWPRTTYPGIIQRLTNLRLLDYAITVNVDPLPITREISKEEKEHDRVAGDYASEKKVSLLAVMEKKQRKIHALMQGQTIPFNAMFTIRAWDKTRDGLNAKAGAIKNAINSMNAAQYFESNLPSTSKNLFFQTWPGWTWGRYDHRKLYAEHRYLADMLPVTSTFTGHLATAEAIYDGPHDNLVGIETFCGSTDNKTPQHAVLLQKFRAERMPPGATTLDTFADFRDWKASHPDEAEEYLRQFDEGTVLRFLKDPKTSKEVRNFAFARFNPGDFPTHRMLQELMMLDPAGAERDQIMEIATLLLPWCRDGNYGCLFDGTSNLSLTGKIAHFELRYIPESPTEPKSAAGFLITNHARKHIMTLPRAIRKRNVYE